MTSPRLVGFEDFVLVNSQPQRSLMVKLFLLGSFELNVKDETIHLPTRKMEALLAYLVLHRTVQNRERIASIFWGDSPDELARRSLRTALSALRKELGEDFIITDRETLQLNPDFPLWVDVHEMEKEAKDFLSGNPRAVLQPSLYRNDLLPAFYEEWILEEREHYRGIFLNALLEFARSLRTNGDYTRAIEISQKIITIDPANERAYQHLSGIMFTRLYVPSAQWVSGCERAAVFLPLGGSSG
jgi:DNA-binding SARP family transcriptional activator